MAAGFVPKLSVRSSAEKLALHAQGISGPASDKKVHLWTNIFRSLWCRWFTLWLVATLGEYPGVRSPILDFAVAVRPRMTCAVLRTPEAAKYLGMAASTLTKTRIKGGVDCPPFIRLSARAVGYLISDLDSWLAKRRRVSTSDDGNRLDA